MNCLCGHFESCEHCTPKREPPGFDYSKVNWGISIPITFEEDPVLEKIKRMFKLRRP